MALLKIENLKVVFPVKNRFLFGRSGSLKALDGVSLEIADGEILGLVGESGCGKSTLGRAIVRLVKVAEGKIFLAGRDLGTMTPKELRRERKNFQMIFQDPYGSLNPRLSIGDAIMEILELHSSLDKDERRKRAGELLEKVGIGSDRIDDYPHQFSGGQRQRIGIARALAASPKLIVADEPVSALDVSVQAQIINLLSDIRNQENTGFLFIAHDLAVVKHISDRIAVMYLGKIVELAEAKELCEKPEHPYTKALLSAVPKLDKNGAKRIILSGDVPSPLNPPPGCRFHPRCPLAADICRQQEPELICHSGSDHRTACHFAGKPLP